MSLIHSRLGSGEVTSISFVPLPQSEESVPRVDLPLVQMLLRELGGPLADLARRARRMGPLDRGAMVLVTGSRRGVGSSTVTLALAAAAAAEGQVLLMDVDFEHPGLSAQLGCATAPPAWPEDVGGPHLFDPLSLQFDPQRTLSFLPLRQPVPGPEEFLAQKTLPAWLAQLRRGYDLILLDGGPVWENAARWSKWVDVALLVCDSGRRPAYDWAQAWDRLEEGGTHVLGIVETFVTDRSPAAPPKK